MRDQRFLSPSGGIVSPFSPAVHLVKGSLADGWKAATPRMWKPLGGGSYVLRSRHDRPSRDPLFLHSTRDSELVRVRASDARAGVGLVQFPACSAAPTDAQVLCMALCHDNLARLCDLFKDLLPRARWELTSVESELSTYDLFNTPPRVVRRLLALWATHGARVVSSHTGGPVGQRCPASPARADG